MIEALIVLGVVALLASGLGSWLVRHHRLQLRELRAAEQAAVAGLRQLAHTARDKAHLPAGLSAAPRQDPRPT
ncbi:type II secretion system protein [Nakamurella aerolata]|uniref:Type II secretion system protein n=1 Tax=Nakamurella aerolata TaxID=1656892 RepID=A0A849A2N6_9ACTN|nr:type II secretion system protein [Nakamurella aerolata]NNG34869.1 type II secretion system protein [Nakamurella aerolata]